MTENEMMQIMFVVLTTLGFIFGFMMGRVYEIHKIKDVRQ